MSCFVFWVQFLHKKAVFILDYYMCVITGFDDSEVRANRALVMSGRWSGRKGEI
jgi:hypothetical protein